MFDQSWQMKTIKILENTLDTAMLRQRVIADNIANVNTPRFKKSYVTFEDALTQALQPKKEHFFKTITTDPRHIQFEPPKQNPTMVRAQKHIEDDTYFRNDLNNVDINAEMANLAKNSIIYEAVINRVSGSLRLLQTVIKGGGGGR